MSYVPVPDPEYGQHVCRRAIRLTNVDGATLGELEDSVHALRCRVEHEEGRVTHIEAEFIRHPMSTCGSALGLLDELIGLPLTTSLADFYAGGKAIRSPMLAARKPCDAMTRSCPTTRPGRKSRSSC